MGADSQNTRFCHAFESAAFPPKLRQSRLRRERGFMHFCPGRSWRQPFVAAFLTGGIVSAAAQEMRILGQVTQGKVDDITRGALMGVRRRRRRRRRRLRPIRRASQCLCPKSPAYRTKRRRSAATLMPCTAWPDGMSAATAWRRTPLSRCLGTAVPPIAVFSMRCRKSSPCASS